MKNINISYMICVLAPAELRQGRATAPPACFCCPAHTPAPPEPPVSMSTGLLGRPTVAKPRWDAGRPQSRHDEQQPLGRS